MAVEQLFDYQAKDGIPQVFLYSQLLLALARDKALYGTPSTARKFWAVWKEPHLDEAIRAVLEKPGSQEALEALLSGPFRDMRREFKAMLGQGREVYEQDRALFAQCRPERLLELAYKFILFDNGVKKIARYQQYFAVKATVERVASLNVQSERTGGVIWHTTNYWRKQSQNARSNSGYRVTGLRLQVAGPRYKV